MSSDFVTQLVNEQPSIVVVGANSPLRAQLLERLQQLHAFSVTTQISDELIQRAYKIIWLIHDTSTQDRWYQESRSLLHRFQDKLTIVMPVISGIQALPDDVYQSWQQKAEDQKQLIIDFNYYYPQALCIFGQDVYQHASQAHCFAQFSATVAQGSFFNPNIPLFPLSLETFVRGVESYLLRPQVHTSVLLKGEEYESGQLLIQLQRQYELLHQLQLPVVENAVQPTQVIPYTVVVEQLATNLDSAIRDCAQGMPRYVPPQKPIEPELLVIPAPEVVLPKQPYTPRPVTPPPPPPPPLARTRIVETSAPSLAVPVAEKPPQVSQHASVSASTPTLTQMPVFRPRRVEHTYVPDETVETPTTLPVSTVFAAAGAQTQKVAIARLEIDGQAGAPQPSTAQKTDALESESPISRAAISRPAEPQPIDTLSVSDELERIFKTPRTTQKVERIENSIRKQKKIQHTSKRRKVLFYGGLTFIGAGLGVVFLLSTFWLSQWWLRSALLSYIQEKTSEKTLSAHTQSSLAWSTQILKVQTQSYGAVFDLQAISEASALVDVGEHALRAEEVLTAVDDDVVRLVLTILGTGVEETTSLLTKVHAQAQQAYESVSFIQAGLEQINIDDGEHEKTIESFKTSLSSLNKSLGIEQQLQPILPALTGTDTRKTYLVLFQNDQELRPTGGYIQAAAFLTFERGSLITHQALSITSLDSRLAGQVTPPEDLKKMLGEKNWLLRDSNWDPNFPDSAARAAWFVENSLGTKVDGVIALNLQSMRALLSVVGPLNISEFNEIITEKNLYERMEFHSEAVLVANSQTPEYSVTVLDALLNKLVTVSTEKVTPLLSALQQQLEDNQMQFTVFDQKTQSVLATIGWTGNLLTPDCPSRLSSVPCQVSSMAQVESNVGVNKANYYIERSIEHTITLNHSVVRHHRTITYHNSAQSNAWPKGPYKAYVRFYMEPEAELQDVMINGKKLEGVDVVVSTEHDKRVVGVVLNVPIQESRTLEISYLSPAPADGEFSFAFFNQVQSGFGTTPTQVTFIPEQGVSPSLVVPTAQVNPSGIAFTPTSSGHGFYGVTVR